MSDEIEQGPAVHSVSIAALAAALAKAQGQMEGARKDALNPHFNRAYADLASVWDACREALSANGLAVVQLPEAGGNAVAVTTLLLHSSGEWIRSICRVPLAKQDAQGVGSGITYARRYALMAMVGVAPGDDDDGEAAVGSENKGNGFPPSPRKQQEQALKAPSSPNGQTGNGVASLKEKVLARPEVRQAILAQSGAAAEKAAPSFADQIEEMGKAHNWSSEDTWKLAREAGVKATKKAEVTEADAAAVRAAFVKHEPPEVKPEKKARKMVIQQEEDGPPPLGDEDAPGAP